MYKRNKEIELHPFNSSLLRKLWGAFFFLSLSFFIPTTSFSQTYDSCAYNGGVASGQISQSLTVVGTCTPAYISVAKGGNRTGYATDVLNDTLCDPSNGLYFGGSAGGQTSVEINPMGTCTPPFATTFARGGISRGDAKDEYSLVFCDADSLLYSGGQAGGQMSAEINPLGTCTPAYPAVFARGGSADGQSMDNFNSSLCNPEVIYSGGMAGGQASAAYTPLGTCTPSYATPFARGGGADGASADTIDISSGCPSVSPICTILSAYAGEDIDICAGDSTQLSSSSGGLSYSWAPVTGLSNPNISNPVAKPSVTTTYVVTISDHVCSKTDTVVVTVNPLPVASITGADPVCDGGQDLLTASGGHAYLWNTGANTDTMTVSPLVTTTYTVTVTTIYGCSDTETAIVGVGALPIADAGSAGSICPGDSIQIGAAPDVNNSYTWSPATGLSSSTIANPKASPADTTTYTVTVTVIATGCLKSDSVVVTVYPLPAANTGIDKTICDGSSTTIGAAQVGTNTYSWAPTTGLSSATDPNPTANPNTTTTYTLTETDGTTGCSKSDSVIVTVNPLPAANVGIDKTICSGASTAIGAAQVGTNTYSWSPTTGLSSGTDPNPTASPTVTTTYTLTETDGVTGCQNTDSVVVTVNPLPAANTGGNKTICIGASTLIGAAQVGSNTYSWSPTTGLSSGTDPNPTASPVASTTYTLTETDGITGCQNTDSTTITVDPSAVPAATTGPDQTICPGDSVQLGAAAVPGNTYSWSLTTGLSSSVVSDPKASPPATMTYTLTETITATGCNQSNTVTVTLNPLPAANTGGDKTICIGGSTPIGAAQVGTNTYSWSPTTGLSSGTDPNPTATPVATTTYTLTETDGITGCQNIDSATVTISPDPSADVGTPPTICYDSSVVIGAAPVAGSTYSWSPATRLSSTTVANPTANPTATITYTLTETNPYGCFHSNSVTVTVNSLPVADAGSSQTICSGGAGVSIGAAPVAGSSYSWSPATGLSSTTVSNPTANPAVSTMYTVTETDVNGCIQSNSMTVSLDPPAYISGGDITVCTGSSVSLIGIGGCSGSPTHSWSTGATTQIITFAAVAGITTYSDTIRDNGGAYQSIATTTVTGVATCTYASVAKGGSADGNATGILNLITCNTNLLYAGGKATGQTSSSYLPLGLCTPSYAAIFARGGNSDGHALNSSADVLFCNASSQLYAGGQAGGQISSNYLPLSLCTPSYASTFARGGNSDGYALNGTTDILFCNASNQLYAGGQAGGQISSFYLPLALCTPSYVSTFARGGYYDGSGYSSPVSALGGDTCVTTTPYGLPIELLRFTATLLPDKQRVECEWTTATEINNDYFTVEKTKDGKNYSTVGVLKGAGNSTELLNYSMIDDIPYKGTSYYRLKQTDFDGRYKYSQLEPITILSGGVIINAYPNPLTEELIVQTFTEEAFNATVEICDVLGRRVFYKTLPFEKNSTTGEKIFINTSNLREGMYLLNIRDVITNKTLYTQRLVKLGY